MPSGFEYRTMEAVLDDDDEASSWLQDIGKEGWFVVGVLRLATTTEQPLLLLSRSMESDDDQAQRLARSILMAVRPAIEGTP